MTANGACPCCGMDVHRSHGYNGFTLTERYACIRCGDTIYAASRAA